MSFLNYNSPHLERALLIVPSHTFSREDTDSEKDGITCYGFIESETERDCGKCLEKEKRSVMVLNSRDAGDPNCPRRLQPDTPVKKAIKNRDLHKLKNFAKENKTALTEPDRSGCTPLHYACWHGCTPIVTFLIHVLSIDFLRVTDNHGWSALHYACDALIPQMSIVECLLSPVSLMDPRQETKKGSTAATLAQYRNHFGIIKYLTDLMSSLSPTNPKDQLMIPREDDDRYNHSFSDDITDHPNGDRNMSRLENRLFTFTMGSFNWPRAHPTGRQLAEQGFVYSGVEERVFCFCCKAVIISWDDGVDPLLKHYEVNQLCQFLWVNFRPQLERLLNLKKISHLNPEYANNSARLHSFQTWNYSDIVSYFKLASAGFYYLGVGLQTRCFSCGLIHDRWRRGDIPVEVHKRRNPRCEFLRNLEKELSTVLPVEPPPPQARVSAPVKLPNYEVLDNRIKSFKFLPRNAPVSGEECARAGLFFLRKPDVMQCFLCEAIVRGWVMGDIPAEKHRAVSPQCKFLREYFPTKLDKQGAYHNNSMSDERGAYYSDSKLGKQGAYSIDPSSLPEPEFTREDLEQMSKKEKELTSFSSLSLRPSDHLQAMPIQPSPQESQSSGYASNQTSYSKPSSEYSSASLFTPHSNSFSLPPVTQQHSSFEPPVQQKPTVNKKLPVPKECVVCMDGGLEVVLLPCGHLCMCQACASSISQCPMCRRPVESTVRVYLP